MSEWAEHVDEVGRARLKLNGWRELAPGTFALGNFIAWYERARWYAARRYKEVAIDPSADVAELRDVLGSPSDRAVVPSTLVVPAKGTSFVGANGARCERVFPQAGAPALRVHVGDDSFELRICRMQYRQRVAHYAEINFGPERQTVLDEPRRLVYARDHRQATASYSSASLVAQALMAVPAFIVRAGYAPDPTVKRRDLVDVGYFDALPGHGSLCARMEWPQAGPSVAGVRGNASSARGRQGDG